MLRAKLSERVSPTSSSLTFEPALRYCLDTTGPSENKSVLALRYTYETVASCLPCKQILVSKVPAFGCHWVARSCFVIIVSLIQIRCVVLVRGAVTITMLLRPAS